MALEELSTSENRKGTLRREIKTTVAMLNKGYTKEADPQVFRHAAGLSEYEQADTLFYFVGTSSKIDTVPILEDALRRGRRVEVPRCISRGIMEVHEIRNLRNLEARKCGIMELGTHAPVIQAERINLAIVPCMSCNHDSRRLGYGGGYYDRYLDRTRAVKAIICREWIMRAGIPAEPHDQVMDVVISEKGVRWLVGQ